MSLHEYRVARQLVALDVPFYALIMAAFMRADSNNFARLAEAFPAIAREGEQRYHAGGGLLEGEAEYAIVQAEREQLGLPPT